jgi:hypothetical protein
MRFCADYASARNSQFKLRRVTLSSRLGGCGEVDQHGTLQPPHGFMVTELGSFLRVYRGSTNVV